MSRVILLSFMVFRIQSSPAPDVRIFVIVEKGTDKLGNLQCQRNI